MVQVKEIIEIRHCENSRPFYSKFTDLFKNFLNVASFDNFFNLLIVMYFPNKTEHPVRDLVSLIITQIIVKPSPDFTKHTSNFF